MTILIGCSGWSYDDWVGRFYPVELAAKKGEWLSYYAKYFNTVEINSTFYRPPGEFQVKSWIKKAGNLGSKGFEYSVKMPQVVTHESLVNEDLKKAIFWATSFEKTCVKPLAEAGFLGGILLQLSPCFKNEGSQLHILKDLLDALSYEEYGYAVEFRHRSWLDTRREELDPSVLEVLRERNVANVLLDGPGFPVTREYTADHAYVRFHGRNYDIWFREKKDNDHRLNRYDYLYKKEQIMQWVPRIREAELKAAKVRVYFNNTARAKSIRNAFQLMDMLSIEHKLKDIRLQNQYTLGEF